MITLHKFGPFLGTPDSSPFVIKVMMLLKLASQPFREVSGNPLKAPHRFLPYIEDEGAKVADSTLIRLHLEKKYHVDFDAGLNAEQRGVAWTVEKMCEDHLYFAMLDMRWTDTANFKKGLGRYMFAPIPAPVRPIVKSIMRGMNAKRLQGLAAIIGDKPFLMGKSPCAADASMFGIVTSILTPALDSPLRTAMLQHANLVAYRDRVTDQYFTDRAPTAAARREPFASPRVAHN